MYSDREKANAWQRRHRSTPEGKEKRKKYDQWHNFKRSCKKMGITPEIASAVLLAQGSCCAICKDKEPGGRGSWHLDHDHSTGKFRGILCSRCNLGIGQFRDSVRNLLQAAQYLEDRKGGHLVRTL